MTPAGAHAQALVPIAIDGTGALVVRGGPRVEVEVTASGERTQLLVAEHEGLGVAIDDAGMRIAVGDPEHARVILFERAEGGWDRRAAITEPGAPRLGAAVALSGDGGWLFATAGSGGGDGAVWAFAWPEVGPPTGEAVSIGDVPSDGLSIAVARDGHTVLIGVPREGDGAALLFRRGEAWALVARFASPWRNGRFGAAVAMDRAGAHAVIGAPDARNGGACWIELRAGATCRSIPVPPEARSFGASVALSGDATLLVIGSPTARTRRPYGAAYRFVREGEDWVARGRAVDRAVTEYGSAVAIGADGVQIRVEGLAPAVRHERPRPPDPEHVIEIGVGPSVVGNWALGPVPRGQEWFGQHTHVALGLDVRVVIARTWFFGLGAAFGYGTDGGWCFLCFFHPVPLEENRQLLELRVGLRAELTASPGFALGIEASLGGLMGWLQREGLPDLAPRTMGGTSLEARLVSRLGRLVHGPGARARLWLTSTDPAYPIELTVEGFYLVAVSTGL